MSDVVLRALRVLGGRPSLDDLERMAAAMAKSGDPVVRDLFGLDEPATHGQAWGRLKAIVMEHDERLAFTALDLFTETREPGSHRRVRERGQVEQ